MAAIEAPTGEKVEGQHCKLDIREPIQSKRPIRKATPGREQACGFDEFVDTGGVVRNCKHMLDASGESLLVERAGSGAIEVVNRYEVSHEKLPLLVECPDDLPL